MKKVLSWTAITIAVVFAQFLFLLQYEPQALAQVAGFFSTISVTSGGSLSGTFGGTATFTNALIASITGNSGTATALATAPSNCGSGQPASGIQANGTANCLTSVSVNTSGNAATSTLAAAATALAATPSKCAGTGLAQGILANGNATGCTSSTYLVQGGQVAGCTTASGTFTTCNVTVNWPAAFADINYFVSCTGQGASDPRAIVEQASNLTPGNVLVTTVTLGGTAVSFTTIACVAVHP